ncbi:helix-turn-helix domain-containing protein [Primorskyibacter sp. 2E233]|uniref:helix-turn-helix domain-containing protein n=1 Tax=Primorskyibacter sp. 2E233 TaxID=3413431 RepID=UPI003BF0B2D4
MTQPASRTLGADLRAIRRMRGLTLQVMAARLDRSVGWLSQVERDLSEPSITDLRHIAAALDIPVSSLFGRAETLPEEEGLIVRKTARRPIGSGQAGLVEELLSPDLTDDFEMVHCTFEPRSRIGEPVSRPTQEVGYMISGQLDLIIAGRHFALAPGDSFRIRGETFEWINPHDVPAQVIWVIAPPVY